MAETRRSVRLLALPLAGNRSRTSRGRCSYNTKAGRLCLSKTSKCLRERDLSFFIILSSDADFCHDTPRKSGFDLPLARYPRARELGFAPPNRCASAFCEKASEIDRRGPPAWVCLSRLWRDWRSALAIVKPETVVVWHRAGFRLFWTWKVRRGQPGRPLISREVRDLIRKMCRQNPSWGAVPKEVKFDVRIRALALPVSAVNDFGFCRMQLYASQAPRGSSLYRDFRRLLYRTG